MRDEIKMFFTAIKSQLNPALRPVWRVRRAKGSREGRFGPSLAPTRLLFKQQIAPAVFAIAIYRSSEKSLPGYADTSVRVDWFVTA
jgi:hypothetical protein